METSQFTFSEVFWSDEQLNTQVGMKCHSQTLSWFNKTEELWSSSSTRGFFPSASRCCSLSTAEHFKIKRAGHLLMDELNNPTMKAPKVFSVILVHSNSDYNLRNIICLTTLISQVLWSLKYTLILAAGSIKRLIQRNGERLTTP